MGCLLSLVICTLSSVEKMKFTVVLSRLLQLPLSHPEVFNSSGWSKHSRLPLFSNKPLSFPDVCEIPLSNKTFALPCHTITPPQLKFSKTSPRLSIAQEGAFSSLPTTQGWEHLLAAFHQASMHTVEDIKTE